MRKLILILFLTVALFAQVEKEITPQIIAGDTASKIVVKDIIYDSQGVRIFVTDALRWNEETETYEVYYTDIAFTYWDIPAQLTDEEIESLQ